MNNQAVAIAQQGGAAEAEELLCWVLELRKKVLGLEHPETLTSISNLATAVAQQGRMAESTKLLRQVVELRRKVLGPDHPGTVESISNLADARLLIRGDDGA